MASAKKRLQVDTITEELAQNPNFAVVKFDKTPHTKFEELRRELKKSGAKFKVVKNALFERAVQKTSQAKKQLSELIKANFPLRENSGLLTLGEDFTTGLKVLHNFAKKEDTVAFKFGFIDDQIYDNDKLVQLATLPGHDELIAKIIGSLKAPSYRLVSSMKFNVSKLVYILKAKGGENNG
jgi:large subunit ribosomal protein L10